MDEKCDGRTGATIEEFGLALGKPFAAGLLAGSRHNRKRQAAPGNLT
jgi:hypothetical protein